MEFKNAMRPKYTALANVWCVADGLEPQLQQSGGFLLHYMFYNRWTHDHYFSNILVFAPDGVVIICALNGPGAMHDSLIAEWRNVYKPLYYIYEQKRGRCVLDSAFSKNYHSFLIKSWQEPLESRKPLESRNGTFSEMVNLKEARGIQQAAEWAIRAFQGSVPRMKDRFLYRQKGGK